MMTLTEKLAEIKKLAVAVTLPNPIFQVPGDGQCFRCCIASVLGLQAEDVPKFVDTPVEEVLAGKPDTRVDYWNTLTEWFRARDLALVRVAKSENWRSIQGFHIVGGGSPRGDPAGHAVVFFGNKMVHDPSPDGLGLVEGTIDERWLIVPARPWAAFSPSRALAAIELIEAYEALVAAQDDWDNCFKDWLLEQENLKQKHYCDLARNKINALSKALANAKAKFVGGGG